MVSIYLFITLTELEGLCTSTPERKYLAFQLFERILSSLERDDISAVFSKNFMQMLSASESTKILKSSSKQAVTEYKCVDLLF